MLETIFGISSTTALGVIGGLATVVSIITQVLKQIVPQSFPTRLLVIIISFVVTMGFTLIFGTISLKAIALGIVGSFVVALISMDGWEKLIEIVGRFKAPKD